MLTSEMDSPVARSQYDFEQSFEVIPATPENELPQGGITLRVENYRLQRSLAYWKDRSEALEKENQTLKTTRHSLSAKCRRKVRDLYNTLLKNKDDFAGFQVGKGHLFTSRHNQSIYEEVWRQICSTDAEQEMTKEGVREACRTYHKTLADKERRASVGMTDHFKKTSRISHYRRKKLKRRTRAMNEMDWTLEKKERVSSILNFDYMSSEEDDVSVPDREMPTGRIARTLHWESTELSSVKRGLDAMFLERVASTKEIQSYIAIRHPRDQKSHRAPPPTAPAWVLNT